MITYTVPMQRSQSRNGRILREQLGSVIHSAVSPMECFPLFMEALKPFFPVHSLLLTYTRNQPAEEWYYLFPEPHQTPAKMHPMSTTREQLLAIQSGVPDIVRIATDKDHSVTTSIIQKFFPETPFSALLLRTLFPENIIICFAMVHKGAETVYVQSHAELLSQVFGDFLVFFRQCCAKPLRRSLITPVDNELRFLPLHQLPGMRPVIEQIWKVARQDCPVLLLGETGSGKEAAADTIYHASARVTGPFVKVNCGSLPETLIDSELFGHEQGAFTDARQTVKGRFERAHRGVLMLDEVGELPLQAQTRLLRVLQEGVVERVGGTTPYEVDVRFIAATHRNLEEMVEKRAFREDLFYRLNVFPLHIPPLRERPEDIPLLVNFLLQKKCRRYGIGEVPEIKESLMKSLMAYPWPGNIRELNNSIERAVILWGNDARQPLHIEPVSAVTSSGRAGGEDSLCSLEDAVKRHILKALRQSRGKISGPGGAAEILKIPPNTLRSKMLKLGISS